MEFYEVGKLPEVAGNIRPELKKIFSGLKKKKRNELDKIFHDLHRDAFSRYDCLNCGNCCRGLGPRVIEKDIDRISKNMRIKPNEFIDRYLSVDEDSDFVFKTMPCPFLGGDNYCHIYESRPKACREYPHTDEHKINIKIFVKNIEYCPVCLWIGIQICNRFK